MLVNHTITLRAIELLPLSQGSQNLVNLFSLKGHRISNAPQVIVSVALRNETLWLVDHSQRVFPLSRKLSDRQIANHFIAGGSWGNNKAAGPFAIQTRPKQIMSCAELFGGGKVEVLAIAARPYGKSLRQWSKIILAQCHGLKAIAKLFAVPVLVEHGEKPLRKRYAREYGPTGLRKSPRPLTNHEFTRRCCLLPTPYAWPFILDWKHFESGKQVTRDIRTGMSYEYYASPPWGGLRSGRVFSCLRSSYRKRKQSNKGCLR